MEERTGWRGQNESQIEKKKNGRLVGAAETSKERAEWRSLQRKNLNILGLPKRKEWPPCHREQLASTPSRPCQKEKEQSRLSRVPDHEGEESQGGRERGGSEREHGVERVESTLNEGRFQGGQGGQARRESLQKVEGSISGLVDAKALHDDLLSLGFTPSLAKPDIGKEVGRRRAQS